MLDAVAAGGGLPVDVTLITGNGRSIEGIDLFVVTFALSGLLIVVTVEEFKVGVSSTTGAGTSGAGGGAGSGRTLLRCEPWSEAGSVPVTFTTGPPSVKIALVASAGGNTAIDDDDDEDVVESLPAAAAWDVDKITKIGKMEINRRKRITGTILTAEMITTDVGQSARMHLQS